MVNLRSKSKARATAPRTASKMEPRIPTPSTASDEPDLSEAALRKLPRSELQKVAMAHKVKANMKSELIIRQLSSLQTPKKTRPAENDLEEGPSRKKFKREVKPDKASSSPQNPVTPLPNIQPSQDTLSTSAEVQQPEAESSAPRSITPEPKLPTNLSYDPGLFSSTESEMTEEEQLDYATPVSSRAETPPPANVNDLKRCVTIMREISAQDAVLLGGATSTREAAARLRRKARDVRDLVKAESGRRERMEAYFRYWQETEPNWDRQWIYGEQRVSDHNTPAGPATIPGHQGTQQPAAAVHGREPALSPEELKQKRQAIIAKQETERRQLKALRRAETRGEFFSEEGSSDAADERSLGDAQDLPPTGENDVRVNGLLMMSSENSAGTDMVPVRSP